MTGAKLPARALQSVKVSHFALSLHLVIFFSEFVRGTVEQRCGSR